MRTSMTIIVVVLITLILLLCNTLGLLKDVFPQDKLPVILKLEKFVLENGQEKDGKMLWNKSIDEYSYNVIVLSKKSLLFGMVKLGTPPVGIFFIASFNPEGTEYSASLAAFRESDFTIIEHKEVTAEEFGRAATGFYNSIEGHDLMGI